MLEDYLNNLYFQFMEKKIKRREFEELLYKYLLKYQEKTCLAQWEKDKYQDYLSWIYPRLRKAIDGYRNTGSSFVAFITSVMRMSSKEYHVRTIIREVTEYSAWSAHIPDLYVHEDAPVYSHEKTENIPSQLNLKKTGKKNPKQLLALILKCYYYVSDDFLDKVACHTGIEKTKLKEMTDELRSLRAEREKQIYLMKERIYCQFYRCIVYEKRLTYLSETSGAYYNLKLRLERARQRLQRMRKRVTRIRKDATNSQIAEVIGVSKGAIDSSLSKLRTKLVLPEDKFLLN